MDIEKYMRRVDFELEIDDYEINETYISVDFITYSIRWQFKVYLGLNNDLQVKCKGFSFKEPFSSLTRDQIKNYVNWFNKEEFSAENKIHASLLEVQKTMKLEKFIHIYEELYDNFYNIYISKKKSLDFEKELHKIDNSLELTKFNLSRNFKIGIKHKYYVFGAVQDHKENFSATLYGAMVKCGAEDNNGFIDLEIIKQYKLINKMEEEEDGKKKAELKYRIVPIFLRLDQEDAIKYFKQISELCYYVYRDWKVQKMLKESPTIKLDTNLYTILNKLSLKLKEKLEMDKVIINLDEDVFSGRLMNEQIKIMFRIRFSRSDTDINITINDESSVTVLGNTSDSNVRKLKNYTGLSQSEIEKFEEYTEKVLHVMKKFLKQVATSMDFIKMIGKI